MESNRTNIGGTVNPSLGEELRRSEKKALQDKLDNIDLLEVMYPNFYNDGTIAEMRAEGYKNNEIIDFYNRLEIESLSEGYMQIEIDNYYGRSRDTRRLYQEFIVDRQAKAYYESLAVNKLGQKRLSFDDVKYRIKAAAALGFNPGLVLGDMGDEIIKRIEPFVKRNSSLVEALADGWERDRIGTIISEIGYRAALDARHLTDEEAEQIEKLQKSMPLIPLDNYAAYKFAEGTSSQDHAWKAWLGLGL
jgi:hypothetical protein